MEIVKIAALGMTGVLLAVFFRTVKTEYGVFIGIMTGFLIFWHAAVGCETGQRFLFHSVKSCGNHLYL